MAEFYAEIEGKTPWGADTAEPWLPDPSGAEYEEWRERVSAEEEREERAGYRLLDGHDAGDEDETCDQHGCDQQPAYVRVTTGEWICPEHAR